MKLYFRLLATLIGLSGVYPSNAQTEGDIWVTGYSPTANDFDFGLAYWKFESLFPVFEYDTKVIFSLQETNASIASNEGEVLLLTNGMEIRTPEIVSVCDTIAYLDGGNWTYWFREQPPIPDGFPKIQTAIILPVPGANNDYSVIYYHAITNPEDFFFNVVTVLETRLRIEDDSSWTVIYKDKEVLHKDTYLSQTTWHACRHANGRDWWLLMHDYEGDTSYRLLFDPDGIRLDGTQTLPEARNILHNAWFSPDGTKYAKYHSNSLEKADLNLYDFDRCTGILSNHKSTTLTGEALIYQGMAFSPDSRYIYVSHDGLKILQYDTWADDLEASEMLVDTNDGYVEPNWFQTTFGPMMPGPDGRIYMFPMSGSSRAVHVIDRPNERGKAAKLLQHHITLQTSNARSVQNFANFRLGPLDGSPCDTLGLDNHPQSRWRHEIENADPLEIRFTDLSFFRPEEWYWDFGDGTFSSEQSPIHMYPEPGLYYACLTVSNEYSSDSSCHWVEIMTTSVSEASQRLVRLWRKIEEVGEEEKRYIVHPNPISDYIDITPVDESFAYHNLDVTITDIHGRNVVQLEITCPCRLKVGSLASGVYFYVLRESGRIVGSGKIVK